MMKNIKKVDLLTIAKLGSFGLSVIGLGLTTWINKKEQDATLKKLVDEHFQK